MLKISQEEIVFAGKEKAKNLIINNQFNQPIIYKIKTNNLQVLEASPNFGLMRASTSLSLLIKSSSLSAFQAKLQILFSVLDHEPGRFEQEWASLNRKQLSHRSISVRRIQQIPSTKLFEKMEQSSSNNRQIDEYEQMFKQQKMMNNRLKQQLQITEERLKQINEERLQIKVNKSIGIICEEYHTSFTTLLLLSVSSFVIGFILSKFD